MINATDIRRGMILKFKDQPHVVLGSTHTTKGNKRGLMQVKMRNIIAGSTIEHRFRSDDKVDQVFVESIPMEYLYKEGEGFVFMNLSTYDQVTLSKELISDAVNYLVPNIKVDVSYFDNEPIGIQLPNAMELTVVETEPGIKGATVTNVNKPAKLETGMVVQVPPFIEQGEKIRVDTREGKYLERAK